MLNNVWPLERPWPFSSALIGQKGRALHEKHREHRKSEIGDLDIAATPLSRVGKSRTNALQGSKKRGRELHPNRDSDFC
jgi:hypothetical protein